MTAWEVALTITVIIWFIMGIAWVTGIMMYVYQNAKFKEPIPMIKLFAKGMLLFASLIVISYALGAIYDLPIQM